MIEYVKTFWRRTPEADQSYSGLAEFTFLTTIPHFVEGKGIPRATALELVNAWNRDADTYRYWID